MPSHQFTYPRVVPVAPAQRPTATAAEPVAPTAPATASSDAASRSQRELVAASLVRCPPRGDVPARALKR